MKERKELIISLVFNSITAILDFVCAIIQFFFGSKIAAGLFFFAGICFSASVFLKVLSLIEVNNDIRNNRNNKN